MPLPPRGRPGGPGKPGIPGGPGRPGEPGGPDRPIKSDDECCPECGG
jgi:hypothetical protein